MDVPGWLLKEYSISNDFHSDDELWSAVNNIFSSRVRYTTSYKFCFLKAILDNIYNVNENLELKWWIFLQGSLRFIGIWSLNII